MATKKSILKRVDLNPYRCQLWITNDLRKLRSSIARYYDLKSPDLDDMKVYIDNEKTAAFVTELLFGDDTETSVFIVYLKDKPGAGTVAHEAVHIKNFVFNYCRVANPTVPGDDEHEAYLVGFVTDEIWEAYYKS